MSTSILLTLCTVPDRDTAMKLAEKLVDSELAACVNIIAPITSVYRWEGKREIADELLLMIKTTAGQYAALESAIQTLHPYELPEILAVPVEQGLQGYLDWVERCTTTRF